MDNLNLIFGLKATKTPGAVFPTSSGTVILYCSRDGSSGKTVRKIAKQITRDDVTLIDLRHQKSPNLARFRQIILVFSLRTRAIQPEISAFLVEKADLLMSKKLNFHVCDLFEPGKTLELNTPTIPKVSGLNPEPLPGVFDPGRLLRFATEMKN